MNQLSKKEFFFISLTLFSIFFGAGNLIFPPMLGYLAGQNLPIVLISFFLSAIVLPILGVIAVTKANGMIQLCNRVHPLFSKIFTVSVFLAIGPLLAIPRNAGVAYDITFKGTFLSLPIYTVIFFAIAFWLSYSPTKLVSRIGKILSPILIALIILLFTTSLIKGGAPYTSPQSNYATSPITQGFLDGYNTLDVLAALNYGIVALVWFKNHNLDQKSLVKTTAKAGVMAGSVLGIIYIMIAHLGASMTSLLPNAENGSVILKFATHHYFGTLGTAIVGAIFTIACMCVCVGLLTSCSEFFQELQPKIEYKKWLGILTLVSLGLANYGLSEILKYSVPVLLLIYPIGIVLVILGLLNDISATVYKWCAYVTVLFSFLNTFNTFPFIKDIFTNEHVVIQTLSKLPLYDQQMAWILPFVITFAITYYLSKQSSK